MERGIAVAVGGTVVAVNVGNTGMGEAVGVGGRTVWVGVTDMGMEDAVGVSGITVWVADAAMVVAVFVAVDSIAEGVNVAGGFVLVGASPVEVGTVPPMIFPASVTPTG